MTSTRAPRGLGRVLYSQCWEDVSVARAALRIRPGEAVLAIAAAGDNVIALLQDDPGSVLAVDLNPAQTALLQLKIAAIRLIRDPAEVASFLGLDRHPDRAAVWRVLRGTLPPEARAYWDANRSLIERGVIHAGRFERYLAAFRRLVLPVVPGRSTVQEILQVTNLDDQRQIYQDRWDSRRWRLLFRVFFSRRLLRRFGRDPAFFDECEIEDIGAHYLARAEHALTSIPIWSNPYVTHILSGRFEPGERTPDYLRPAIQSLVRDRLDRIDVRTASLDDVLRDLPDGSVDAFYLSDVFELATPAQLAATLAEVARVGRAGARICYWNNLVARQRPDALADRLQCDPEEARRLHALDRAFLYSRLVVETVGSPAA